MNKNIPVVGIIILFIMSAFAPMTHGDDVESYGFEGIVAQSSIGYGDVIVVDDEGDGDYTSIKEALAHANPGDTIEVYSGTYYEQGIVIDKEGITLQGIPYELGSGNDTGKPFIDGQGLGKVIRLVAEGISLIEFRIENGPGEYAFSIIGVAKGADNCLISNNDISHTIAGCVGCSSNNNRIINNNISHSAIRSGVVFGDDSRNNTISGNTISDVGMSGIDLWSSHYNNISYNRISRCGYDGIDVLGAHNTIFRNHIENNSVGLGMYGNFNTVKQNNFINNDINAYLGLDITWLPFHNTWFNNYWNRPRLLPYPIFGFVMVFIPWVQFDWRPAREPYDI